MVSVRPRLFSEKSLLEYPDAVTGGNLGTPVSQLLVEHPLAGPAVLEVSCFQLETIHTFHPSVAIFSNLVPNHLDRYGTCLLYTSDAADDLLCVDLGGRRIIKKKKKHKNHN